jgi:aspartate kinase
MLVVQKFGGTSVASVERIKASCEIVKKNIQLGKKIVVVVSAMSGQTDALISKCKEITSNTKENDILLAEMDSIISTGEQVCAGLFASYLNVIGIKARSFTGLQAGILTDKNYTKAQIEIIDLSEVKKAMEDGFTPIITGFQGFSLEEKRQTTLGRGGSDTSAIAIAAELDADKCEIYKDVEGVFTGDPTIISNPKKEKNINFNIMLEISSSGAKVLELRSVNFAKKYNVETEVLSSFLESEGTLISENNEIISGKVNEKAIIYNLSYSEKETFAEIETKNISETLELLNEKKVDFQVIFFENKKLKLLVKNEDTNSIANILDAKLQKEIAKISIIGVFLKSDKILEKALKVLEKQGVQNLFIDVSESKITFIIEKSQGKITYSALHDSLAN